jgi:hypothetical protein
MQPGALPKTLTIAVTIALLVVAAPGRAQICGTGTAPTPPALPTGKTPPALPMSVRPPSLPGSSDSSLASGLVSYWKLDDASGTTATDSLGSNTGTWQGTLGSQWAAGKINGAGNFNGTDDAIGNFPAVVAAANTSRTICLWFKTSSTARQGLVSTRNSSGNIGWSLLIDRSAGSLSVVINAGVAAEASAGISTGQWYHACYTFDNAAGVTDLYLNGAQLTSASTITTGGTPAVNGYIGLEIQANSYFKGIIDEVGIWNRALSASEVATLYHSGSGNPFGNSSCGFSY